VNFLRRLALQEKKTWWQLASRCCWNRARRLRCFLSASVKRKDLQFGTWADPSFQRHYRFRPTTLGSRSGKGLISTPSYIFKYNALQNKYRSEKSECELRKKLITSRDIRISNISQKLQTYINAKMWHVVLTLKNNELVMCLRL